MSVPGELARAVRARAENRCQYCRMHQALQGATFHLEHVLPRSKGGATDFENLALACPNCNLHKSDRTQAVDLTTGETVSLFQPSHHLWSEHFAFDGYWVGGLTPIGRATVLALDLNHPRRLRIRAAEEKFGLF